MSQDTSECWLNALSTFDFEVEHRASTKHNNTDALSRGGFLEEAKPEGAASVNAIELADPKPLQIKRWTELATAQGKDEVLSTLIDYVKTNTQPSKEQVQELPLDGAMYAGFFGDLVIDNGVFCRWLLADDIHPARKVLCLPQSWWEPIIERAHRLGGHMGINTTLYRLKRVGYFPHTRTEDTDHMATCTTCQQKTGKQKDQTRTLCSLTAGSQPLLRCPIHPHMPGHILQMARSLRPAKNNH